MTDPTHPDDGTLAAAAAKALRDAAAALSEDPDQAGDSPAGIRWLRDRADEMLAVPPAAGPDDELRARIEATLRRNGHVEWDDVDVRNMADHVMAVLAAVPSAGLPTPPEAHGPVVRRDERGQMWVDGHMYDAEPEQTDDMRREARELVAVAAFLDAETAAADVAEGGAR